MGGKTEYKKSRETVPLKGDILDFFGLSTVFMLKEKADLYFKSLHFITNNVQILETSLLVNVSYFPAVQKKK